ncbi:hypothetical protein BS78_02G114700 [Paspalum vaginatum]|nr:hypothetical protein BS78_02G114700 [Paspalum vaginatum]
MAMAQLPRPAAAGEDDVAFWEDALDIDDSDIGFDAPAPSPLLRPDTAAAIPHPHLGKPPHPSHHHHHNPRPAAVQDATLFRSDAGSRTALGRGGAQAADADFLLPPWLCALQFLGNKDTAWKRPGIKVIKDEQKLRRAPLVAGVVTSCKPNRFGDLFLTLKDPTDSIGVSVHKKVLLEGNIGEDISIGCAILLSKVLRKDCAAPSKQVISSTSSERREGEGSTSDIMMKILAREGMEITEISRGTSASNYSTSTWDIYGRCSLGRNRDWEDGPQLLAGDQCCKHISNCSANGSDAVPPDGNGETASSRLDTEKKHNSDRNMKTELDYTAEQFNGQRASIRVPVEHLKNEFIAENACSVQPTEENATAIIGSVNPKRAMPVVSVAEWTDEQLSELFADY